MACLRWSTTPSRPVCSGPPSTACWVPHGHVTTAQSLGGEDFGWYLDSVPGAMARLGTRTPGGPTYDLHQGNLRIDEAATCIASRVLAEAAVTALAETD